MDPLEKPINLTITAREVNTILRALGALPFGEIAELIGKIKTQGDAQFAPPQAEAPPNKRRKG